MVNAIRVPTFTPVETEKWWSNLPALYLSPLFCNREVAVIIPGAIDVEGNQDCTAKELKTTLIATILKVATYILTAGILPLLAIILNAVIRCGTKYQYVNAPQRPIQTPQTPDSPVLLPPVYEDDLLPPPDLEDPALATPATVLPESDTPILPLYASVNREPITPEEQWRRLSEPMAKKISAESILIPDIANLVAEYALEESLTNWHKALVLPDMLPEMIPPLPSNIHEILDSNCPIREGSRVRDTHSLYLIPPGTVNELEARVKAYGEAHLAEYGGINPLQFRRYSWNAALLVEHGNRRFDDYDWILISTDIVEGSYNQPYAEQAQMVAKLGANYVVPLLREAAAFLFLHKVATGESVLQARNEQNGNLYYTVQTTHGNCLAIGGSAPSGVIVHSHYGYNYETVGVAALRKF